MNSASHKAGFVNIVGKPNVGKSTIMNLLIGEKLSIITSKAQTTRHRIIGISNSEDYQIVYSDTPGLLDPKYKLQENMLKASRSALVDADILVYVTEVNNDSTENSDFLGKINKMNVPVILVMNKIDLADQKKLELLHEKWTQLLPKAIFLPVSAKENFNVDKLSELILQFLPLNPPFYPKDELSDKSERFFTGEIVREKILVNYSQEIPYSVEVEVEEFREDEKIIRIRSVIFVERESQKGILIGKKGELLKKTGTEARIELERFFNKKVYLELFVKVMKDWRNNDKYLKGFGYR